MMRRVLLVFFPLAALVLPIASARAADDPAAFRARVVAALRAGDVPTVKGLFAFPLRLTQSGGEPASLSDPYMLKGFGVFEPDSVCGLERAAITDNGKTVRFGDTAVAARVDGTFRITDYKVAGGHYTKRKQPVASLDLKIRGAKRQAAGNLEFDEVDVYEVALIKNVVLQGTLERFPGNKAVLQVKDAKGKPVNAAASGRRSWTGTIPESGTYRIEVVRRAAYCDPLLTYLLTLTAR